MKKLTNKQITWWAVGGIIFLIILSAVLAYTTSFRDPISAFFKRFYPAVLVQGRIISVNDLEQGQDIAARFGVAKSEAKEQIINDSKADVLVDRFNIRIPNDAAANELRYYMKGNEAQYQDLINRDFSGSEYQFYKYIVRPQLTNTYLRMKYYSDISQNDPEYARAQSLLERMTKGEKFEDLARTESADQITGQIGGDLGFYESGQILPELENQISVSELGKVREDVIVSRLGYHIIYPVEHSIVDGRKVWHAKHILLVPQGYEEWLAEQMEGVSVKTLKNI